MPVIFTDERPDVYTIDQIYDPDTNPQGSVIPKIGSLVIDIHNDGILLWVTNVDPVTKKPSYAYVRTSIIKGELETMEPINKVIEYANVKFYMYYDKHTKPYKLMPDRKAIILGEDASYYIVKRRLENEETIISVRYDASGNFLGNKIPLLIVNTKNPAIKYLGECYTTQELNEDELLIVEIYDNADRIITTLYMYVKPVSYLKYSVLNDVIVEFNLNASQELDDETFYVYPNQDLNSLSITPILKYASGLQRTIGFDNNKCILYGLEDFTPSYPGQSTQILAKYYLSQNELADPSITQNGSFLTVIKTIKVISGTVTNLVLKALPIPIYDINTSKYVLMFYLYDQTNNQVLNVTSYIQFLENTEFNGIDFDNWQFLKIQLNLRDIIALPKPEIFLQSFYIRLKPFNYIERYLIRETMDDTFVYGVDSPELRRPILYYNNETQQYRIDDGLFPTKELFLEAFYYKLRPPYNTNDYNQPIEPTHFTIREVYNGSVVLPSPKPVDEYYQPFTLVNTSIPATNTVYIVEFLKQLDDNNYKILFGAPVDVYLET